MSNFKKTIETQKAINEAVEAIFQHFKREISYAETLETMADAQVEMMQLMEINRYIAACPSLEIMSVPVTSITNFEWCTYQYNLNYSDVIAWKRKPVYQYDLDGNFIKKFKCGHQAEQELGFTIVHAIYESKRGYTHGFLFSLEPHTKEYWDKVTKGHKGPYKRVIQYDDYDNEIARFNTVTEAAKAMNVTVTCISNCCKGKNIHAAGYKWRFL